VEPDPPSPIYDNYRWEEMEARAHMEELREAMKNCELFPPCGEISLPTFHDCNLGKTKKNMNDYEVRDYANTFEESFFDTKEEVTDEVKQYISGLFNGMDTNRIDMHEFLKKLNKRFENESLMWFMDGAKIARAGTFRENDGYFTIWETDFDKHRFYPYFEEGLSSYDIVEDWDSVHKVASDRFYFGKQKGEKINTFYFRVYKNKNSGYNKVSKEKKGENMNSNRNAGNVVDKITQNGREMVDKNRDAVKLAATLKVGSTANQVGLEMIRKALPNKRVIKATKHPVAEVLLANVVAMAIKQASTGNSKAEVVGDAMVTSAMVDLVNTIDLKSILDKIVESVDISALTSKESV
jgi:hypothetical protein